MTTDASSDDEEDEKDEKDDGALPPTATASTRPLATHALCGRRRRRPNHRVGVAAAQRTKP
jgi:hypothetical protein